MNGSPPDDDQLGNGIAFGAPTESSGKSQKSMTPHIIVMRGRIMLVDDAISVRTKRPMSGSIHCSNGRD